MLLNNGQIMTEESQNGSFVRIRLEVNPKARRLILRLDEKKREAVAIAPHRRQLNEAFAFARSRLDWIVEQLTALPQSQPFAAGAHIPFRGVDHQLSLQGEGRLARVVPGDPMRLVAPGDADTFARRIERFLRKEAKNDLDQAVSNYSDILGVRASRVTVKDTRSRWGSCTSDRKLAFSWRLVLAPPEILNYVAAHECAHMLEMNHSPAFWAHVTRCDPNWRSHRKWLRENVSQLQAVGNA